MASVFLSYDHDDAERAALIAASIEQAGHTVWWDREIYGGAEFNSEIERAVELADVVVVLWSEHSVRSAWVRDEAAEGRDQRKLVPVCLDRVKPPMGFRQFQTIDLTTSKGRRLASASSELLRAIEKLGKPAPSDPRPLRAGTSPVRSTSPMLLTVLGAMLVALALLWWRWPAPASGAKVAVIANDGSQGSRALASNLLVQLGSLQATNPDQLSLVEADSAADAHLTFKVGAVGGTPDPRADLSLIDNRSKTLLWSRAFVQPQGNEADLRQQLAYSAGQVLRCTTDALAPTHPKLKLPTLRLYLNGCADLSDLLAKDAQTTTSTFKKVIEQAPSFKGGWANLLLAQIDVIMATDPLNYPSAQRKLRADIAGARKIDPTMTEAYLAESWVQPPRPIMGWMRFTDEAVRRDSDHSQALEMHSLGVRHVGLMREAVSDARRAVRANPISPSARESLVVALMDSGAIGPARHELRSAEQLWPGATSLANLRFMLEYRYGDPKAAMRMMESGAVQFPPGAHTFIQARIAPSPENIRRATSEARTAFQESQSGGGFSTYVQALATFGLTEDAIKELLTVDPRIAPGVVVPMFRPHMSNVRRHGRFMEVAKRFGLISYWQETGRWPDFCSEPGFPYDCKKAAAKLS